MPTPFRTIHQATHPAHQQAHDKKLCFFSSSFLTGHVIFGQFQEIDACRHVQPLVAGTNRSSNPFGPLFLEASAS